MGSTYICPSAATASGGWPDMWPDLINGSIELIGAFFTWRNWQQLRRDRSIAGVYWPTTAFFSAWVVLAINLMVEKP